MADSMVESVVVMTDIEKVEQMAAQTAASWVE